MQLHLWPFFGTSGGLIDTMYCPLADFQFASLQVVDIDGQVLEKPADPAEAVSMLSRSADDDWFLIHAENFICTGAMSPQLNECLQDEWTGALCAYRVYIDCPPC